LTIFARAIYHSAESYQLFRYRAYQTYLKRLPAKEGWILPVLMDAGVHGEIIEEGYSAPLKFHRQQRARVCLAVGNVSRPEAGVDDAEECSPATSYPPPPKGGRVDSPFTAAFAVRPSPNVRGNAFAGLYKSYMGRGRELFRDSITGWGSSSWRPQRKI